MFPPRRRPSSAAPDVRAGFRPDIEGLRAVAVLLVLLNHLLDGPTGGFIGVDVFFVLSGFLITGLLVKQGDRRGRPSLRDFYARRIRRILPMAVLVLVVTNVLSHVAFVASRAKNTLTDSLWALGFAANHHFSVVGTDYFQRNRPMSPVQHYWSLSVEEQFYVFWPILLIGVYVLVRQAARHRMARTLIVVGAVASFIWNIHQTAASPTQAYFSTAARAWELGLGALVALSAGAALRMPAPAASVASWAGLGVITWAAFSFDARTSFPGWAALVPVAATAMVVASGHGAHGIGHRWALGSAPVRYVGRISYSLYLWHWPCIVLGRAYFGDGTPAFYLCGAGLSVLLTVVTHHLIEDPIRRSSWLARRPGLSRRTLPEWIGDHQASLGAVASLAVVAVFYASLQAGSVTPVAAGETARLAGQASAQPAAASSAEGLQREIQAALGATHWTHLSPSLDDLQNAVAPEWIHDHCLDVFAQNVGRCSYGPASAAKTAVVLGDSTAISYVPGLRAALGPKGWRIQMLTLHACSPIDLPTVLDGSEHKLDTRCAAHRSWVRDQLKQLHPDLLIVTDAAFEVDRLADGGGDDAKFMRWQTGWTATLRELHPLTKRLVVLPGPPGGANLQNCVTRTSSPGDCTKQVTDGWLAFRAAEGAAAKATGTEFIDPEAWFCFAGSCPAVVGSTPVYGDGEHLTAAYARRLAPLLSRALRI